MKEGRIFHQLQYGLQSQELPKGFLASFPNIIPNIIPNIHGIGSKLRKLATNEQAQRAKLTYGGEFAQVLSIVDYR